MGGKGNLGRLVGVSCESLVSEMPWEAIVDRSQVSEARNSCRKGLRKNMALPILTAQENLCCGYFLNNPLVFAVGATLGLAAAGAALPDFLASIHAAMSSAVKLSL